MTPQTEVFSERQNSLGTKKNALNMFSLLLYGRDYWTHRWRRIFRQQECSSPGSHWKYDRLNKWEKIKNETIEISKPHNEEKGLGKFDTH